jgi:hypothetical protein
MNRSTILAALGAVAAVLATASLTACDDKKPEAKSQPASTAAATATAHASSAPAKPAAPGGGW